MPVAGFVTIVLVTVAVLVIARYLILIGSVLRAVSSSLDTVIGAVAAIPEKTEPLEPVLTSINADLATARGVLEGLLARKLGGSGNGSERIQWPTSDDPTRPTDPDQETVSDPEAVAPPAEDGPPRLRWPARE